MIFEKAQSLRFVTSAPYLDWVDCAEKLLEVAKQIVGGDNLENCEDDDPAVYAASLMSRTFANLQGVLLMIDHGLIVEARTLTRSCFENLFWAAALAKKKQEFVKEIKHDDATSRKKRISTIKEIADEKAVPLTFEADMAELLAELTAEYPTKKTINQAYTAAAMGLKPAYLYYRQLSGDAAHPSGTSLERYVTYSEDGTNFDFNPTPMMTEAEALETLEWACTAVLGVCVAANTLVKEREANPLIRENARVQIALKKKCRSP